MRERLGAVWAERGSCPVARARLPPRLGDVFGGSPAESDTVADTSRKPACCKEPGTFPAASAISGASGPGAASPTGKRLWPERGKPCRKREAEARVIRNADHVAARVIHLRPQAKRLAGPLDSERDRQHHPVKIDDVFQPRDRQPPRRGPGHGGGAQVLRPAPIDGGGEASVTRRPPVGVPPGGEAQFQRGVEARA